MLQNELMKYITLIAIAIALLSCNNNQTKKR